jgi:hypothetical protein
VIHLSFLLRERKDKIPTLLAKLLLCLNSLSFISHLIWCKKKVKHSLYRLGQALSVPQCWGSQISRQSAHEGCKVVNHTHQAPLLPRKCSWYSFLLEAEVTQGHSAAGRLYQRKIPVTALGIRPVTFLLVAQCLNKLRYWVPPIWYDVLFQMNAISKSIQSQNFVVCKSVELI